MNKKAEQNSEKQQISVTLHGADLLNFKEFKKRERLMHDAEAARKLILERLDQLEPAA